MLDYIGERAWTVHDVRSELRKRFMQHHAIEKREPEGTLARSDATQKANRLLKLLETLSAADVKADDEITIRTYRDERDGLEFFLAADMEYRIGLRAEPVAVPARIVRNAVPASASPPDPKLAAGAAALEPETDDDDDGERGLTRRPDGGRTR